LAEKEVLRLVGEKLPKSTVRMDPLMADQKEKEGKFDMAAEEAAIAQQMQQMNQALGVAPTPQTQVIKDKKKKRR